MKTKKCPFCKDGFLERKTIKETYTYKGHTLEVNQPGEFCNSCEEGILNGADLAATAPVIRDFQAQLDELLTSNDLRTRHHQLIQKPATDGLGVVR